MKTINSSQFLELIKKNNIDFLDFGCSNGGSLEFAKKYLGGLKGLGIDIDDAKIKETNSLGHDAINYDINNIPNKKIVRFCILKHFLEHVPSHLDVRAFITKACVISKEFVYIRQPYFDADSYLFEKGLKLYWSDWTGHPNRMTSLEFYLILSRIKKNIDIDYSILATKSIKNSVDSVVHPIESDNNQQQYNSMVNPPKNKNIIFKEKVFKEIICLITLPGYKHQSVLDKIEYDHIIFSSNESLCNSKKSIVESFKRKLKNFKLSLKGKFLNVLKRIKN